MKKRMFGFFFGAIALLACNGNTVQSPTAQVKQCLFDTECMSSQRCSREKDNLMGVCVDKVAAQPADPSGTTTITGADSADGVPPLPPPAPSATTPAVQPQPGDISL